MNPLLHELEAFYLETYGTSDIDPDELTGPREALLSITCHGEPGGVVGVRQRSATVAELVRLWVPRTHRCHNHGKALVLAALERATRLGYARMTATSDLRHADALALGAALGARPIEPYGPYATSATTRCIEFDLTEKTHHDNHQDTT